VVRQMESSKIPNKKFGIRNKWHRDRRGLSKTSFMLCQKIYHYVKPSLLYFGVMCRIVLTHSRDNPF
jgi:hypothetical protein